MCAAHRAQLLKQSIDLIENQNRFSQLDYAYQDLQSKKRGYEQSSEALLKSAISVHLEKGQYSSASLHQRSAWVEKACSLRSFTLKSKAQVSAQLEILTPERSACKNKIEILEDQKNETGMKLLRSKLSRSMALETAELEDICEVSLLLNRQREL